MTAVLERLANVRTPRELVSRELFDTLVARLAEDEQIDKLLAERVVEQTLIFLKASADEPGAALSPTKVVDPGWHTFILHTEPYAEFCERIAGFFIHHRPICNEDIQSGNALARTVEALHRTGYPVDEELWTVDAADCNSKCHQCHATCHHSN